MPYNPTLGAAINALSTLPEHNDPTHPDKLDQTACWSYTAGQQHLGTLNPDVHLDTASPHSDRTNALVIGRYGMGFGWPIAHFVGQAQVADPDPAKGYDNRGPIDNHNAFVTLTDYLRGLLNLAPGYQWSPEDQEDLFHCYNFRVWLQHQATQHAKTPAVVVPRPVPAPAPVPAPTPAPAALPPIATPPIVAPPAPPSLDPGAMFQAMLQQMLAQMMQSYMQQMMARMVPPAA